MFDTSAIVQSVLHPAGRQAAAILQLWRLMLWTATVVFVLVIAAVVAAVIRGRLRQQRRWPAESSNALVTGAVSAALVATTGILFVLLAASVWTTRALAAVGAPSALSIEITGHQWWWEVEYEDAVPSQRVTTANEIHIPVGRPVVFKVTSRDVIHSLWIPTLQGKRDLIPGMTTAIWLEADRPGRYRGQCAEFCGLQHAHMAIDIVAESDVEFYRWLSAERQPAAVPRTDPERHGQAVFVSGRCAACHAIRGTPAFGSVGPDLTHLASRASIAAGTLPNTRGHLGGWIADPQPIKPGTVMPPNPLPADDLQDLIAYLAMLR